MNLLNLLRTRLDTALAGLAPAEDRPALLEMVRRSPEAKFGDYQANCAMSLAKKVGQPPRQVAQSIVQALDVADLCQTPEIAGPGFVNFRFRDDFLIARLQ